MSKTLKLKPINDPYFYYGDGEIRVKATGGIAVIEVFYLGKPILVEQTGWKHKLGKRKLLIWSEGTEIDREQILFKYAGYFRPLRVRVYDWGATRSNATIVPENIHLWELLDTNWEDLTMNWEDLKRGYAG